jgi:hypothetical protein
MSRSIIVKKYKGDRRLARGLRRMARRGYEVQSQSTRKALFSAAAGVFTHKQIHTVTFRRQEVVAAAIVSPPSGGDFVAAAVVSPPGGGDFVRTPSTSKHWFQETTMRDVLQGRAERQANREQA